MDSLASGNFFKCVTTKVKIVSCKSDIQTSFSGNMKRLNLLFAFMLAFVSYSRIYSVTIGDIDKSEKEENG